MNEKMNLSVDMAKIADDIHMPYPRICAHRGFSTIAPENSLPAYGAAIALGADEIELDVWPTKDGELVSIHDSRLERISTGEGNVWEHTLAELLELDFGIKYAEHFSGLKLMKLEDVLSKFGRTAILNIHMKMWDFEMEEPYYQKIADLIRKYNCEKYVYMMSINEKNLQEFHEIAPEIHRCVAFNCIASDPIEFIDRAEKMGLQKIQISDPNEDVIDYAHAKGLICNIYYADEPALALHYLEMGADTILSNNVLRVSQVINAFRNK